MGGGKGPEAPPPRDYYKETTDSLRAQVQMAPQLYAAEAAFRPMYQRLELGGYRNALLGRITRDDLSEAGKSEFDAATAKADQAAREIPILERNLAQFQAQNHRGRHNGSIQSVQQQIEERKILAAARPEASSYSDRGLLDILEKDMLPAFARSEAAVTSSQRSSDIADVERLGQRASQAYLDADPRSKSLIEAVNAEALKAVQAGGSLTPEQQRYALQTARLSMADRGLALSNQGMASDVLSTYQLGEARRTAAMQNAGAVLGLNKQFTADPFQAILGRQGQAFNAGMSQQQFASGFASNIGPRLFSPESQYMSDLQGSNQQTAASYAAAKAQMQSGMMQGIGSLVGGAITGGGSFALAAATKAKTG